MLVFIDDKCVSASSTDNMSNKNGGGDNKLNYIYVDSYNLISYKSAKERHSNRYCLCNI